MSTCVLGLSGVKMLQIRDNLVGPVIASGLSFWVSPINSIMHRHCKFHLLFNCRRWRRGAPSQWPWIWQHNCFDCFVSLWVSRNGTNFQLEPSFLFLVFLWLPSLHDWGRWCQHFFFSFSLPYYWRELDLEAILCLGSFNSVLPDLWVFSHLGLAVSDICWAEGRSTAYHCTTPGV